MHNIKQSDIVRHKRRGTYGIVTAADNQIIRVVWHLGDGMRISYDHKATTKVVELVHKYSDYARFYEAGRTMLATYFGYKFDRNHNRSQALGAWLDSLATDKQRGLPFEEDDTCTCLTRETTELRNVITSRTLKDMQEMVGPARAALDFQRRATGRTTAIALTLIGVAMQQAYQWHNTVDHFALETNLKADAHRANLHMMQVVKGIIAKLGFVGFEFQGDTSIRFVPIVKETTKYEPKTITTSLR